MGILQSMEAWAQRYMVRSHTQARSWCEALAARAARALQVTPGDLREPWVLARTTSVAQHELKQRALGAIDEVCARMTRSAQRRMGYAELARRQAALLLHATVLRHPKQISAERLEVLARCAGGICMAVETGSHAKPAHTGTTFGDIVRAVAWLPSVLAVPGRPRDLCRTGAMVLARALGALLRHPDDAICRRFVRWIHRHPDITAAHCDMLTWLESGAANLCWADMAPHVQTHAARVVDLAWPLMLVP